MEWLSVPEVGIVYSGSGLEVFESLDLEVYHSSCKYSFKLLNAMELDSD